MSDTGSREGRGSEDPGVRRLAFRPIKPDRGEDPEEEVLVEKRLARHPSAHPLPNLPVWGWMALALLLLALFVLLSASGTLLAPLLGETAGAFDYLHEFAHDGRHLLGAPCH